MTGKVNFYYVSWNGLLYSRSICIYVERFENEPKQKKERKLYSIVTESFISITVIL